MVGFDENEIKKNTNIYQKYIHIGMIDIQLVSYIKIADIEQNSSGKAVTQNSIVKFTTCSTTNQNNLLTHSGSISHNVFHPGIVKLLVKMRQGEKIQVQTNQQPPNQFLIIHLVDVQDGQQFIHNYKKAQVLKNKGNQCIKIKNYQKAVEFYQQGYKLVQYQCSPEAQTVKISLLSNLTLAYLNTMKYEECIQACEKYLLNTLQANKKIVYRKASANKNLKRWQESQKDIRFGLQICANDQEGRKDFQSLQETIRKQKKMQSEREKKVYSKMFG